MNFWILPEGVSGKASTNSQRTGVLYAASRSRQYARSSCGVRRRLTGGYADEGGDHLTPLRVGQAEDRHLGDGRVIEEDILDLARVDVLAAADDHVLDPALDAQVAPAVEGRQVPGVVPALGVDGGRRGLRGVVVAAHDHVPAGA